MGDSAPTSKRVPGWGRSLFLFGVATIGEFVALAGWYWFRKGHPLGEFGALADAPWFRAGDPLGWFGALVDSPWLRAGHPLVAGLVLLFGFVVERDVVVRWLDVPERVITPAGNLRPLWLVVAGVTIAEIVVWTVWVELAEAHEPWFAAALLVVGIHLVHGYEVALLKHRELQPTWKDPGVIVLTALEAGGGVWALWLAVRGRVVFAMSVLLGALLIEHILQVVALKKDAEARGLRPPRSGGPFSRDPAATDAPVKQRADVVVISGMDSAGGVFLILLLFVVVFALLARKLRTPYPIVLVIAGLALSVIPGTPYIQLKPDLVFTVVLPPLLYGAAWNTSWRELRHNMVSVISVACGLVSFTIAGVALAGAWLFPGVDWRIGVILGAVVAPTDAVAAAAIATQVGLPQRLIDLLEGESLVNDATGLLALEFGLGLVHGGAVPTVGTALARFLYLVSVGIGAGAVIALAVDRIERWIDDGPIEIAISLMVPYAAYLGAEAIHASGVLAVVTSGLILSRRSAEFFSPFVRLQVYSVWNAAVFILNGFVFVLVGLQLSGIVRSLGEVTPARLVLDGALFSALIIALRLVWIFPAARASYFIRHRLLGQTDARPSGRALFVFGWSGMRGVVSLAAAMALPASLASGAPFPQRSLIVFLAFSVVVSTLVVQGLTLGPMIRALGLAGATGAACEEEEATRIAINAALAHLEDARSHDQIEYGGIYDDLAQHYRERLEAIARTPSGERDALRPQVHRYQILSHELLTVQRRTVLRLRRDGRINDQVLRNLERDLDLQEARVSA